VSVRELTPRSARSAAPRCVDLGLVPRRPDARLSGRNWTSPASVDTRKRGPRKTEPRVAAMRGQRETIRILVVRDVPGKPYHAYKCEVVSEDSRTSRRSTTRSFSTEKWSSDVLTSTRFDSATRARVAGSKRSSPRCCAGELGCELGRSLEVGHCSSRPMCPKCVRNERSGTRLPPGFRLLEPSRRRDSNPRPPLYESGALAN
jgi:hypothetical protein